MMITKPNPLHECHARLLPLLAALLLAATPLRATNHSGTIGTETWTLADSPHYITNHVTVPDGETLTVEPGCQVLFNGFYALYVYGALVADGSPAERIIFSSAQPNPAPYDWRRIYFDNADPGTVLDNCDISYGGHYANVYIQDSGGNISVTNCSITHSFDAGIYLTTTGGTPSTPLIEGCAFSENTGHGLRCTSWLSLPSIHDCAATNNGGWGLFVRSHGVQLVTGTTTVAGNGGDGIFVYGNDEASGTWLNHGVPYRIYSGFTVANGDLLTLEPGCTLKLDPNVYIYVYGTLVADGTPAERITFTSSAASPAPGDWHQLYYIGADPGCVLDNCDLSYGGDSYANLMVKDSGSNLAISNSSFTHSAMCGIEIHDVSSPTSLSIAGCLFTHCGTYGMRSNSSEDQVISDCVFRDNENGYLATGGRTYFQSHNRIVDNDIRGVYMYSWAEAYFGDDPAEWNDVYGNGVYNLQAGSADIFAPYVYWGTTDPGEIEASIWHWIDDNDYGLVGFEPFLDEGHAPGGLPSPGDLSIEVWSDTVTLSWSAVPDATSYRVYSSTEPYDGYTEDLSGIFAGTTWSAPVGDAFRCYRVTAVAE